MEKLILIRHGQTDYTLQRRYCGHEDIPLNDYGIKQVTRLRKRLNNIRIDNVYSSNLKRALETAQILFGTTNNIIMKINNQSLMFFIIHPVKEIQMELD